MTNATIKSSFAKVLAAGALLSGAMFAGQAMACVTTNWSATSGAVVAGDPSADGIARYQGLCGLQATGQGFVQDNNPGGIDRIVARFYVLNDNTGPAEIYAGFGDTTGGSQVFSVELGASGNVTLTDNATGLSVSQAGATNWLSVEIDWARGAGNGVISLSVNGQGAVEDTALGNGAAPALQSVRLGNLDGAPGVLGFDSYESRRSTAVGRLVACDAQNDGNVDILDALAVINESNEVALATGTPDCTENGTVDILDVLAIVNIINS